MEPHPSSARHSGRPVSPTRMEVPAVPTVLRLLVRRGCADGGASGAEALLLRRSLNDRTADGPSPSGAECSECSWHSGLTVFFLRARSFGRGAGLWFPRVFVGTMATSRKVLSTSCSRLSPLAGWGLWEGWSLTDTNWGATDLHLNRPPEACNVINVSMWGQASYSAWGNAILSKGPQ